MRQKYQSVFDHLIYWRRFETNHFWDKELFQIFENNLHQCFKTEYPNIILYLIRDRISFDRRKDPYR